MSNPNFYAYPRQHTYLTEWELNFWDALYFLVAQAYPLRVTARQVARYMAGEDNPKRLETARQYFVKLRQQAVQAGLLIDETPDNLLAEEVQIQPEDISRRWTHRRGEASLYHLRLPLLENADGGSGLVYKPQGYVRSGWIMRVQPGMVKQALNFLLLFPHRQQLQQSARPLEKLLKEFTARRQSATGSETNSTQARQAFETLTQLGLLRTTENGCYLDWRVLQQPPNAEPAPAVIAPALPPNLLRSHPIQIDYARASPINLHPIRFPADPDDGKLISARLVIKLFRRDWAEYVPQTAGRVHLRLLFGRKHTILAEWQQDISNTTATKTKTHDLTSILAQQPAINGLNLAIHADPAPPWLHIKAYIELQLQK